MLVSCIKSKKWVSISHEKVSNERVVVCGLVFCLLSLCWLSWFLLLLLFCNAVASKNVVMLCLALRTNLGVIELIIFIKILSFYFTF